MVPGLMSNQTGDEIVGATLVVAPYECANGSIRA